MRRSSYVEIFLAMGKKCTEALPDLTDYAPKVIFPAAGGPGPKAKALKKWLTGLS